jgi:tRNA (cmo5U34)-methyltransferase
VSDAPKVFAGAASIYDEARRRLVPGFDAFYDAAVEALDLVERPIRNVLDLGAGTGLLSARIARHHPEATFVLLDAAKPMLDLAARALGASATTLHADLRDPLPAEHFDAVVSGMAIHHLDDAAKRSLFERVRGRLRAGGAFINADQVLATTSTLASADAERHRASSAALGATPQEWADAVVSMSHDLCSTVDDQLSWLRAAEFEDVDCLYRRQRFAVLFARIAI